MTHDPDHAEETPLFASKQECKMWSQLHVQAHCSYVGLPSSPSHTDLCHMYTTAVTWTDVVHILSSNLVDEQCSAYFNRWGHTAVRERCDTSLLTSDSDADALQQSVRVRLAAPVFAFAATFTHHAAVNTLRYLFHHMRCGIFVRITDNHVSAFLPFVNGDGYSNTWSSQIVYRDFGYDHERYHASKPEQHCGQAYARVTHKAVESKSRIRDPTKWWANAGIICDTPHPQIWGDSFLSLLRSVFETLCSSTVVRDCMFFVNKRDHPQLRAPDVQSDPQSFLWTAKSKAALSADGNGHKRSTPRLPRERYQAHIPVLSFYSGPNFLDIPMPTHEDWMTCTGAAYPPDGQQMTSADEILRTSARIPWEHRKAAAVWRGSNTGPGQRQYLCDLSQHPCIAPYVDARITQYSTRDRVDEPCGMVYCESVDSEKRRQAKQSWLSVLQQMQYKYCIYVCGHAAAARYGSMLLRGCTVIEVEPPPSVEACELWFHPIMRRCTNWNTGGCDENTDAHVLVVKHTLEDLVDCVKWCIANDACAKRIAENGQQLAKSMIVNRQGMLQYTHRVLDAIAELQCTTTLRSASGADGSLPPCKTTFASCWNDRMMDTEWPPYIQ